MSLRARSVGEILDGALRLYRQDVGLYVFVAVVAAMPFAVGMVLSMGGANLVAAAAVTLIAFLAAMIATIVVWAALMHLMNERLEGREPVLGASLKRGFGVGHRVLWGAILAYAIVLGAMGVIFAGAGIAFTLGSIVSPVIGGILGAVAFLALLFTVGVRVMAGATLFLPGILVERCTGYGSVKRGFALAREGRGRILLVITVASALMFIPVMATYFLTGTASLLTDPDAVSTGAIGMGQLAVQQLLLMLSTGFTTPFFVACMLLLYYDQRVRLEAFDLEAAADALAG